MSQVNPSSATRKPTMNVFTALLLVATLLLAGGVAWMFLVNTEHSSFGGSEGGPFVLIDQR